MGQAPAVLDKEQSKKAARAQEAEDVKAIGLKIAAFLERLSELPKDNEGNSFIVTESEGVDPDPSRTSYTNIAYGRFLKPGDHMYDKDRDNIKALKHEARRLLPSLKHRIKGPLMFDMSPRESFELAVKERSRQEIKGTASFCTNLEEKKTRARSFVWGHRGVNPERLGSTENFVYAALTKFVAKYAPEQVENVKALLEEHLANRTSCEGTLRLAEQQPSAAPN